MSNLIGPRMPLGSRPGLDLVGCHPGIVSTKSSIGIRYTAGSPSQSEEK